MEDEVFRSIDEELGKFNLFEAMGAVKSELKHSNFLEFLLSPNRSHGIGSAALHQLIKAALKKLEANKRPVGTLELMVGDLDSAVVYRESDNIDLLIELKALDLIVVIENKIWAEVSEGQLQRYRALVESKYPKFKHLFVLLTPDGYPPDDPSYLALSYSEIAEVIETVIKRSPILAPEIKFILEHYIQLLRRHIVGDEKLIDLARQVYERHKEAFNFIFEHRPQQDNLLDFVRKLLENETSLLQDVHGPMLLRFVPSEWRDIAPFNMCPEGSWTHTRRNLVFEVKAYRDSDRINLSLISGPADSDIRKKIYSLANENPKVFKGLVKPMGAKWATVYARNLLTAKEADGMEQLEEKETKIKAIWTEFLVQDLPELKRLLKSLV